MITSLSSTLHTEKEALSKVHSELKDDNMEMSASIVSKIEKLQAGLAIENQIMDKLAVKTEKAKVLSVQVAHANQQLDTLKTEKLVIKSCVADVNQYLQTLLETRDSLITVSIRQHLAEKLRLVFSILNRLKGVSALDALPKQGQKRRRCLVKNSRNQLVALISMKKKPNPNDSKGNEALGSKGKGNLIDDDEEEEDLSEEAQLK